MTGNTSKIIHSGRACEEMKPWTSFRRFASFLRICLLLVFNPLVFAARAFPIPRRTENSFAEKSALFGFESPVINRLRILNFTLAPRSHRVTGSDANCDLIKTYGALFAHQLTP